MKKKNIIVVICLFIATIGAFAQKAETVLEKAAKQYANSNGMSIKFSVNIRSEKQGIAEAFEGTIQMKGEKFLLISPDMKIWYDGKTQWTYNIRSQEVYISNPSGSELQYTNPMTLLSTYKSGFTLKYIGESTSDNGKIADDVLLSAKKGQDIEKIETQIERATSMPVRMKVTMKNGIYSQLRINSVEKNLNLSDLIFVFNSKDYPNAVEIDLR